MVCSARASCSPAIRLVGICDTLQDVASALIHEQVNYNSYKSDYSEELAAVFNVTNCTTATDKLDCLRSIPIDILNPALNSSGAATGWNPVVDGDFIQRWASIQLDEGDFVKVARVIRKEHSDCD
jgi:hypothetical protein